MKILDRVSRYLGAKQGHEGPLIEEFPSYVAENSRRRELRELRDRQQTRVNDLRALLAGRTLDAELVRASEALARGADPGPDLGDLRAELGKAERSLAATNAALQIIKGRQDAARVAASEEICRAAQPAHRRIVREMARHLALAEQLGQQERALRDELTRGGADLGHMIPALTFAAFVRREPHDEGSQFGAWLGTLRRMGVLRKGENPADFAPDDEAARGLGALAAQQSARPALATERHPRERTAPPEGWTPSDVVLHKVVPAGSEQ